MYSLLSGMKKLILILIALLLISNVIANNVLLNIGESYSDEDKNITLLKLENKKALVCVNNQKGIIATDKRTDINGAILEMKRYYQNYAKFDIEIPNCYKCVCKDDCLNQLCGLESETPVSPHEPNTTEPKQEIQKIEIIEKQNISTLSIIAVILIILVALLGIYTLWKKIA